MPVPNANDFASQWIIGFKEVNIICNVHVDNDNVIYKYNFFIFEIFYAI